MSLRECQSGECVEVVDVRSTSSVAVRMREIGMVRGCLMRIIRSGTPMIVQLGNTRFCLRDNEAALVQVRTGLPLSLGDAVTSEN